MIEIASLIVGITALFAAVLSHVKHSKCLGGLMEVHTHTPPASNSSTSLLKKS